ncbi:MAG: HesA/MoeB/ThiF family protein [Dehalococcoidia bacterium]|nr:MAG: HesA/MoeB/ThiF family protein [Dehalococcoidia bacterium]
MLTKNDLARYERQILYPDLGEKGQKRLKQSQVVVAGLGGLGCSASLYLTCAGVGHVTLIDCDRVELSNLNRQVLHYEEDIGEKKPFSAAQKLAKLNSSIEVIPVFKKITAQNASKIIKGANLVIDGMDNFKTRFIVNKACVAEGIPFIHGGVHGLFGEVTTILPGRTPCLACIFPEVPQRKVSLPVFGVTPALIAILQVTEAIKLLAGFGSLLTEKMLYFNGDTMDFTFRNLVKNQNCRVCGTKKV